MKYNNLLVFLIWMNIVTGFRCFASNINDGMYQNGFSDVILAVFRAFNDSIDLFSTQNPRIFRTVKYLGLLILVSMLLKPVLIPILRFIFGPIFNLIREFIVFCVRKIRLGRLYKFTPMTTQEIADINKTLDKVLDSVVGHTEEKKKLKSILLANAVKKFKNIKFKLRKNVAEIVEIYGNPGIGKTELIKNLCETLCRGKKPFVITSAMIDQKAKGAVLDQLLYLDKKKKKYTDFYYYIRTVPHGYVIFDEFDKFWKLDPVGLTEFFRGILDLGYIVCNGKKLNCSNITFYVTFNIYGDGGLSHDASYMSRIQMIKFGDLTERDVYDVLYKRLNDMSEKLVKQCGVSLFFNRKLLSKITKNIVAQKQGFRPGNRLLDYLASEIFVLWAGNNYKPLNANLFLTYSNNMIGFNIEKKATPQQKKQGEVSLKSAEGNNSQALVLLNNNNGFKRENIAIENQHVEEHNNGQSSVQNATQAPVKEPKAA